MNEQANIPKEAVMGNKFGAFLAGGLAGAVVALLYAPRSGQETRAMVTDKMSAAWGEAQELGSQAGANMQHAYQDAASKGQEVVQDVAAKGQELYGQATQRVQEAADNIKPGVLAEERRASRQDRSGAPAHRLAGGQERRAGARRGERHHSCRGRHGARGRRQGPRTRRRARPMP